MTVNNSSPPRAEETEACFAATRALCNSCGRLTDAKLVFRGQQVYLIKWCPQHGRSEGLVCSDAGWFRRSLAYVKPATRPLSRAVEQYTGCPASCGLCPEHQQHTCVPIIEITGRCNLSCPICLVDRGRIAELSLEQFERILDRLLAYEGRINMLTLSGGEPTLHPRFLELLAAAQRSEIGIVSVSTNGLMLAEDEDLIRTLRDRGAVISLQFDGFSPATSAALRGRPELGELKRRLLDRLLALGARISLTVTLARGVNEQHLGEILELFFAEDQILSLMIQPLAYTRGSAAGPASDPPQVLTIPDVVEALARHSHAVLRAEDFSPLPCSHPSCFALTYLLKTAGGELIPLPRLLEAEDYLDIIKNQALLNTDTETLLRIRDSLYTLWSSDGILPNRDAVLGTVRQILLELNRLGRAPTTSRVLDLGTRHIKSIFIHQFMDRFSFDLSRAIKCCNHYPQVDGRLLPACIRNNLPPEQFSPIAK